MTPKEDFIVAEGQFLKPPKRLLKRCRLYFFGTHLLPSLLKTTSAHSDIARSIWQRLAPRCRIAPTFIAGTALLAGNAVARISSWSSRYVGSAWKSGASR